MDPATLLATGGCVERGRVVLQGRSLTRIDTNPKSKRDCRRVNRAGEKTLQSRRASAGTGYHAGAREGAKAEIEGPIEAVPAGQCSGPVGSLNDRLSEHTVDETPWLSVMPVSASTVELN